MSKHRQYRREIGKSQLKSLQEKYEQHINSKGGFLSAASRKILLKETTPKLLNEADFWYRTKLSARNALIDLVLLSEVASERELRDILYKEFKRSLTISLGDPPLTLLLMRLFPTASEAQSLSEEERGWRAKILEEVVSIGLEWYIKSGFLRTEVHNRIVRDVLDIITTMSSGRTWEEKKKSRRDFANAL